MKPNFSRYRTGAAARISSEDLRLFLSFSFGGDCGGSSDDKASSGIQRGGTRMDDDALMKSVMERSRSGI